MSINEPIDSFTESGARLLALRKNFTSASGNTTPPLFFSLGLMMARAASGTGISRGPVLSVSVNIS